MDRSAALSLSTLAFAVVTGFAGQASAQGTATPTPPALARDDADASSPSPVLPQGAPPAPPASPAPAASSTTEAPLEAAPAAHTGFQLALRTGVAVPFGRVDSGAKISDSFTPQASIVGDLGIKVASDIFLGAYIGVSVGGVGDTVKQGCDAVGVDCTAVGVRFGIQAHYHFNPDGKWNPWIGYGVGLELVTASGSKNNAKLDAGLVGVEFAHFMAGAEYRVGRVIGIGPFADFAVGQYGSASVETVQNGVSRKTSGELSDPSLHEWLTLGLKVTLFP
jgi:hypothetical protein